MKPRESWIDTSKGVAIGFIVLGHSLRGLNDAGLIPTWNFNVWDDFIYSFHLAVFFLVSGALFTVPPAGSRTQAAFKKASIFLYPYFIWVFIQGLITASVSGLTNHAYSFEAIPLSFLQPPGQFWFLPTLLVMVLLVNFISVTTYWKVIVLAIAVAALLVGGGGNFSSNFIFYSLGAAALGVNDLKRVTQPVWLSLAATVFGGLSCIKILGLLPDLVFVGSLVRALIGFTGAVAVIGMNRWFFVRLSILEFIGRRSLEVYLLHIIFSSGTRIILSTMFGFHDPLVHLILGVGIGVGGPLAVCCVVERMKWSWVFSPPWLNTDRLPTNGIKHCGV